MTQLVTLTKSKQFVYEIECRVIAAVMISILLVSLPMFLASPVIAEQRLISAHLVARAVKLTGFTRARPTQTRATLL